jgi:hypothetical protein
MNKDQFIKLAEHYNKRALAALMIPFLLAFACIVAYWPFQHRFEEYLGAKFAAPTSDILALAPSVTPFIVAFIALIPLSRRIERKLGVSCSHCGKALACFKAIVVASKNCPHCGVRVLDDNL